MNKTNQINVMAEDVKRKGLELRDIPDQEEFFMQLTKYLKSIINSRFAQFTVSPDLEEDFLAAGYLAFVEAYRSYEIGKGHYCTYSAKFIFGEMHKIFNERILNLTTHYANAFWKSKKAITELENQGKSWNLQLLSEMTGLRVKTINVIYQFNPSFCVYPCYLK